MIQNTQLCETRNQKLETLYLKLCFLKLLDISCRVGYARLKIVFSFV